MWRNLRSLTVMSWIQLHEMSKKEFMNHEGPMIIYGISVHEPWRGLLIHEWKCKQQGLELHSFWFLKKLCISKTVHHEGDVVKLFFWVSFYYIFKKSKAFLFKSKAFHFSADKFLTNQKLFVLNQKLFFFLLTSFLQIKSFSF